MNRQEFRVLTSYGYAVGPEIVPAPDGQPGWILACELAHAPRETLTGSDGRPARFRTVDDAAAVAQAFGHPECAIFFHRQDWEAIVES